MIVAGRADIVIADELLADVGMPTRLALLPHVGGDLESVTSRLPRLFLLAKPGHCGNVIPMTGEDKGVTAKRREW